MQIQAYRAEQREAIVAFSLRAWAPVFASVEQAMDPDVFRAQTPDWRASQREAIEAVCGAEDVSVFAAVEGDRPVGFTALKLHREDHMGEIYMIAVDPDFQRRGIAKALTEHALAWFTDAGMTTAMVETGGDPGHAPARRTYESTGFRLFPVARYFTKL